jgi:hypothetical protein
LRPKDIIAISFISNRYGFTKPLEAIYWYREIYERGARFPIPEVTPHPRRSFKEQDEVYVSPSLYSGVFDGLRDIEAATADTENLIVKRGQYFSGGPREDSLEVDEEGAKLFFAFEADRALSRYHCDDVSPSVGAHYFLRLGTVKLYKGSHSQTDRTMRLAALIEKLGLRGILNQPKALMERLSAMNSTTCSEAGA